MRPIVRGLTMPAVLLSLSVDGTVDGDVARVELDPEGIYADVDDSDDVWTP